MGSAQSVAGLIFAVRAVDPAEWESPEEFAQSIHRLGTGGHPTTAAERKLAPLVKVLQDFRDDVITEASRMATKKAIDATQLSNDVAIDYYIDNALRRREEAAYDDDYEQADAEQPQSGSGSSTKKSNPSSAFDAAFA